MLIHNGDIMAAVIDPPINPVRIREKGSTKLTGSCYSGWLGAPEPSVSHRIGQSHPAVSHTGGCSSPELDQVDQHSSPGRVKIH